MKSIAIILLLSLLAPPIAFGQGETTNQSLIHGFVKDRKTHEPIAGALVEALSRTKEPLRKQITKVSGEFLIRSDSVRFIRIVVLGYYDTTIAVPKENNFTIELVEKAVLGQDIVVTAQRHTTAVQDIPVSMSIVKADEINGRSPEAVDNALRYIPGVSVTESQVNIRGSSGYARSVGSRVLFLLDGMPFLSADNGDIKFDALPLMNIERIEVVKGAGSALYGSSALGGVINVITRKPSDTLIGAINANAGFYDKVKYPEWRITDETRRFASIEGGASCTIDKTGLLASFAARRNEGYRLGDDSYKSSGFAKVTTPFSDHDRFETSLLFANEDHGGFLYWKDLNHAFFPSDSLGAINGRIHSMKANVQSSLQSILSDHFLLTTRASVLYTQFSTDPTVSGGTPGPHSNATNYYLEFESNSDILDSLYLTTGILGLYQNVNSDLFQSHHGTSLGAFAQGEYKLSPFILTLGLRADGLKYDESSSLGSISPKFGASLNAGGGFDFRASFGTGFRAPTIGEKYIDQTFSGFHVIPNPDLVPERSISTEIGGSYRDQHIFCDGAMFYSSFDNLIEAHFVSQNGASVIQFGNLTKAEIFGHEEVIEYYPFSNDDLTLRLGYTYVFPRDRITKQILNFRPRHLLQARAETKLGSWSLSSDFRYISKYESVDSILIKQVPDGDARVNAYIWDVRLGYAMHGLFGMPVIFSLQVQNLLNYYYVEIVGNIAPIRNFSLRVETLF
ncbi:MAG: TonB-dependent receptor [Bacteroidota bacterium]|nr:TonB-dependent receptor [Bacteroidota bacterium]